MKEKVLVTRSIPEKGMQVLGGKAYEIVVHEEKRPMAREEMEGKIGDVDGMITMLYDRVDGALLDRAPRLKVVANLAVGTDNIDITACTARGVAVTNTPGVLTDATADLAFALILAAARQVVAADRYIREGRFNAWDPLLFVGADLKGKKLGIIGMGRIGRAVAKRALGFGMKIIYYSRTELSGELNEKYGVTYLPLEDVIREADFLSLHLPYTTQTHHLINRERLAMMKPGSFLINTARGAHVDEAALVEHLKAGKIAGAGLDVYEREPQLEAGLAELENVVLLPHLGSATEGTRSAMAVMAAQSVCDVLEGRRPENLVNGEVYEK